MKNILIPAAGALAFALSASPALADSVSGEVRFIDRDNGLNGQEYVGSYSHHGYILREGAEISYITGDTPSTTKVAGNVGVEIAGPAGVVLAPKLELGYAINEAGPDGAFWGAGMVATRAFGPLTAVLGIRHRDHVPALHHG